MGNCISSTQVQETITEPDPLSPKENLASEQSQPSPSPDPETTTPLHQPDESVRPLEIEPGNLNNAGYVLHQAIVHNDVGGCNEVFRTGFHPDRPLRYQATLPGKRSTEEDKLHYEFQGTALHVACIYRRPEIVCLLLEHDADPNKTDKFGRTPIILTVTYWPRVFLDNHWPDEADKSSDERRYYDYLKGLHAKSYNCLQSLCQFHADVNKAYLAGQTALHLAARYHLSSCVETLLRYGAHVNACDHKGLTPLHYVCNRATHNSEGQDIVTLLVEHGANVNACDNDGNTALHLAAINGCGAFIQQLVRLGAHPDQINARGLSPLFLLLDDIRNVGCIQGLNTILNESTYIRIFDEHHHLPALLALPELKGVRSALLDTASVPPLLKLVCRRTIRSALGIQNVVPATVNQLPCPPLLQSFILSQNNNFELNVNSNVVHEQAIVGG